MEWFFFRKGTNRLSYMSPDDGDNCYYHEKVKR